MEPAEAYYDFPEHGETSVRIQTIPDKVGPRTTGRRGWRQTSEGWTPLVSLNGDDKVFLEDLPQRKCGFTGRKHISRGLWRSLISVFVMLGIFQFVSLACGIVISFFPDEYDRASRTWMMQRGDREHQPKDIIHWPTDFSRGIVPIGCHSHNDYWRRVPLYSALQAGCVSVEADVWVFDGELYVGHSTSSLTSDRTLQSMYIKPLVEILEKQNPITKFQTTPNQPPNGVFDVDPAQTLILLIDFKTDGAATWPAVVEHLEPLRERGYLTYFNGQDVVQGPITIVGTGNTPFNLVTKNCTYRDIFFDAPLDKLIDDEDLASDRSLPKIKRDTTLGQGMSGTPDLITVNSFNNTNSFYASVSLKQAIGIPWPFHFSQHQMDIIRTQIRVAHHHGLKVRYWGLPGWPIILRNHVWRILVQEGVDILNVDDLVSAIKGDWRSKALDWWF